MTRPAGRRRGRALAGLAAGLLLAGCTPGPRAKPVAPGAAGPPALEDLTASFVPLPDSRYPNLYEPDSFAVFLSPETLFARLGVEAEAYHYPPDEVDEERRRIADLSTRFYICELHLMSAFADAAVARDAVVLHEVTVTLENDEGRRSAAVGAQVGVLDGIEVGDTQVVRCTNIVLFPRGDLTGDAPLLAPTTQRLKVVLTAYESAFEAVWQVTPSFAP